MIPELLRPYYGRKWYRGLYGTVAGVLQWKGRWCLDMYSTLTTSAKKRKNHPTAGWYLGHEVAYGEPN